MRHDNAVLHLAKSSKNINERRNHLKKIFEIGLLAIACFGIMTSVYATTYWNMDKVFQPTYDETYSTSSGTSYNRKMNAKSVKVNSTTELGMKQRSLSLWIIWSSWKVAYATYSSNGQMPGGLQTADGFQSDKTEYVWFLNNNGSMHANLRYELDTY